MNQGDWKTLSLRTNPNLGQRYGITYPIKIEDIVNQLHALACQIQSMEDEGYTPIRVSFTENYETRNFRLNVIMEDKRFLIT